MRVLGEQAATLTSVQSACVRSISAPTAIGVMVRTRYSITIEPMTAFGASRPLRHVKEQRPDMPVMMVTAYGDDERRRKASELGAAEFLPKPVDFDQLKTQLRQLSAAAD